MNVKTTDNGDSRQPVKIVKTTDNGEDYGQRSGSRPDMKAMDINNKPRPIIQATNQFSPIAQDLLHVSIKIIQLIKVL